MSSNDISANLDYAEATLSFEEAGQLPGTTLLDFGAPWCGHCQAASAAIKAAVAEHPQLRHIKIYDGKGKPLGRAFKVKLWPTLILLRDGHEVARLVRPVRTDEVRELLSTTRSD